MLAFHPQMHYWSSWEISQLQLKHFGILLRIDVVVDAFFASWQAWETILPPKGTRLPHQRKKAGISLVLKPL